MEDFENKKVYKIMWAGSEDIFWDVIKERKIFREEKNKVLREVNNFIDIQKWIVEFEELYKEWLENDKGFIYDLNHPINKTILEAIKGINSCKNDFVLFYWYDIDRDKQPNFIWEVDPINGKEKLLEMTSYHRNNRFISLNSFLIFPDFR